MATLHQYFIDLQQKSERGEAGFTGSALHAYVYYAMFVVEFFFFFFFLCVCVCVCVYVCVQNFIQKLTKFLNTRDYLGLLGDVEMGNCAEWLSRALAHAGFFFFHGFSWFVGWSWDGNYAKWLSRTLAHRFFFFFMEVLSCTEAHSPICVLCLYL